MRGRSLFVRWASQFQTSGGLHKPTLFYLYNVLMGLLVHNLKAMKKLMLIIVILKFSLVYVFGQDCKKEIDEFTGDITYSAEKQKIGKTKGLPVYFFYFKVFYFGDSYRLLVNPEYGKIKSIPKDAIIYLKFEDETIIKLTNRKANIGNHKSGESFSQGSSVTIWYNSIWLKLSDDNVATIKQKKLMKIKCFYSTYEVKPKKGFMIKDAIECIDKIK